MRKQILLGRSFETYINKYEVHSGFIQDGRDIVPVRVSVYSGRVIQSLSSDFDFLSFLHKSQNWLISVAMH